MSTAGAIAVPDYDTKEGLAKFVKTLKGLKKLIGLRSDHRDSTRSLQDFVVLGNWWLDTHGRVWKFRADFVPRMEFANIPDVMSTDEFDKFIKKHKKDCFYSWVDSASIPQVGLTCFECGNPWTVRDCHNITGIHFNEDLPVGSFIGASLQEFIDYYRSKSEVVYCFSDQTHVQNKKWIDLSLDPKYNQPMNKGGWILQGNDYILQPEDVVSGQVFRCFHPDCNMKYKDRNQKERFEHIFYAAGFTHFTITPTPNQYRSHSEVVSCSCCASWFNVKTPYGTILIGWRKRVINIDWSDTGVSVPGVPGEDVTCGDKYTHAWGEEKALEYLTKIKIALDEAWESK